MIRRLLSHPLMFALVALMAGLTLTALVAITVEGATWTEPR